MIRLTIIAALSALAGCAQDRVLIKPQVVEVPVYVREPIPDALTIPLRVNWPDGSCWTGTKRVLCNGQLASLLIDYREALEQCNADRKVLRAEP